MSQYKGYFFLSIILMDLVCTGYEDELPDWHVYVELVLFEHNHKFISYVL